VTETHVQLKGRLGAALDAALSQLWADTPYSEPLVVQDVRWEPGQERLFQDYRGDLSGRYLDAVSVAVAGGHTGDLDKATRVLLRILECQQPGGSFGPPSPAMELDHGAAWGHGRLLQGLLSARRWAPTVVQQDLAHAITRLADRIAEGAPRWARSAQEATHKFALDPLSSILPLVEAARSAPASEAAAYRRAAQILTRSIPEDPRGLHSHGFLLALRGGLALIEDEPDVELEAQLLAHVELVERTSVAVHGGVLEHVCLDDQVNTEACATSDWIMLQLGLHRRLGDDRHLELATRAVLNGLLHAQRRSGHFGCQTIGEDPGLLVSDYAPEAWWCCTFHAIRALHEYAQAVSTVSDNGVTVHVPIDLALLEQGETVLEVSGDYPWNDRVRINGSGRELSVEVVVPETVSVDQLPERVELLGDRIAVDLRGTERIIDLELHTHDWLALDRRGVLPPFGNTTQPDSPLRGRATIWHGPLLLTAHLADNAPTDLLTSSAIVWPAERRSLGWDGAGVDMTVCGYDSFESVLRLTPLASEAAARHDDPVRVSFGQVLSRVRSIHHQEK
jgi:hypothetical protein